MKTIIITLLNATIALTLMGQRPLKTMQEFESYKGHKGIETLNQGKTDERHPDFEIKKAQSEFFNTSLAGKLRLDSLIYKEWDETSPWLEDRKEEYGYDANGNIILDIQYSWDESTHRWLGDWKDEYSYDFNRNRVSHIDYKWDKSMSQWVEDRKIENKYDANGNMTSENYYGWDESMSQWVEKFRIENKYDSKGNCTLRIKTDWLRINNQVEVIQWKTENSYDTNGNITLAIHYEWDESTSQWIRNSKTEHSLIDNGKNTFFIRYNWNKNTSRWLEYNKEEFGFDDNGNWTLHSFSRWDESTSQWVGNSKRETNFDNNGNRTLEIDYSWDDSTNLWLGNRKYEFIYDYNGNRISSIDYEWNNSLSQWVDIEKSEFGYDARGNPSIEIHSYWYKSIRQWYKYKYQFTYDLFYEFSGLISPGSYVYLPYFKSKIANLPITSIKSHFEYDKWVSEDKITYYYSEVDADISDLGIVVFPNPATEFIVIGRKIFYSPEILELFDIFGNKVLYQKITDENIISINHLAKGLYLYRIKTAEREFSGKIIIQ